MRKNRVTVKERLSNGQWLVVFFNRKRVNFKKIKTRPKYPDTKVVYLWSVAVYIGDSIKSANRWIELNYKKRTKNPRQLGKCGLEGLQKALNHVIDFCGNMKERDELHIYCDDKKRYRAYKWLLRFNGFIDHSDFYAFRHPNWWHWKENETQGIG